MNYRGPLHRKTVKRKPVKYGSDSQEEEDEEMPESAVTQRKPQHNTSDNEVNFMIYILYLIFTGINICTVIAVS